MLRRYLHVFSGNASLIGSQYLMLLLLPWAAAAEVVGWYALGLAIASPTFMLVGLSLRHLITADASERFTLRQYMTVRLLSLPIGLALIAGVGFTLTSSRVGFYAVMAVGLQKTIEAVSDIPVGRFLQTEQTHTYHVSMLSKGVAGLAVFAPVALWTGTAHWPALATAGVYALILVGYDLPAAKHCAMPAATTDGDDRDLRELLVLALPLSVVAGLGVLNTHLPHYFLQRFEGPETLGRYATLLYLGLAGQVAVMSLGHATIPRFAELLDRGDVPGFTVLLKRNLRIAVGIGVPVIVLLGLGGPFMLELAYGKREGDDTLLAWVLGFGCTSFYLATTVTQAVTATRRYTAYVLPSLAVTTTGLICVAMLVPGIGAIGAAIGLTITAIATTGLLGVTLRIQLKR